MTRSRIYPPADARTQWFERDFDRATFDTIEKFLIHTTETEGWPSYKAGASAPTLTYHPRRRAWRQHNYVNTSARALVDPATTPVRENRDRVVQLEIICYSDEKAAASVGGLPVSELTDEHLGDIANFVTWLRAEWGGPPLISATFPFPWSRNSGLRMSSAQFDAFRGILGHLHASGNEHWDPGAFNAPRLMQLLEHNEAGGDDMQFADVIPGTNPPVTVGQALARGAYAYAAIVEGGSTDKRIDAMAEVDNSTDNRLDAAEAKIAAVPALIDAKLAEAAVTVTVDVKSPPAAPAS